MGGGRSLMARTPFRGDSTLQQLRHAEFGGDQPARQDRCAALGFMNAPSPFAISRPEEVVEYVRRRPEGARQSLMHLGCDIEAIEPIEPDKSVVGSDKNEFPFAMGLGCGHRRCRLDHHDPWSERCKIRSGQNSALRALDIDLEEMDRRGRVAPTDIGEGVDCDLSHLHVHAGTADGGDARCLGRRQPGAFDDKHFGAAGALTPEPIAGSHRAGGPRQGAGYIRASVRY